MNERFHKDADLLLSGLTWEREDAQRVLNAVKGDSTPMKKKLSVSFALMICITLIISTVALAIGLTQSRQYTAVVAARNALMNRYNLTQEMITLFDTQTEDTDGTITITFTAADSTFTNTDAIGRYTVIVHSQGDTTVLWSHDDADPVSWVHTDLTSTVWGAPQLTQLLTRYAFYTQWWEDHADVYSLSIAQQAQLFDELKAAVAPLALVEGPKDSKESTIMPAATPVVNLSDSDASRLARQTLYDRFGLTEPMLTLFTEVQSLDMQDGSPVHSVSYLPVTADNPQSADWRWVDTLAEKLGSYIVQINAADGTVVMAEWSLDDVRETQAYSESDWANAKAYSAAIIPHILAFLHTNKSIITRYPDDQREWFSVEDAAAYDKAFRDAGFNAAVYNHGLPKETDITVQQATALAREAMAGGYNLTEEQLSQYTLTAEYLLDDGGTWWIFFWGSGGTGYVSLRASDGEIQMVTLISAASSNG